VFEIRVLDLAPQLADEEVDLLMSLGVHIVVKSVKIALKLI
jgi:hypothetical protein